MGEGGEEEERPLEGHCPAWSSEQPSLLGDVILPLAGTRDVQLRVSAYPREPSTGQKLPPHLPVRCLSRGGGHHRGQQPSACTRGPAPALGTCSPPPRPQLTSSFGLML